MNKKEMRMAIESANLEIQLKPIEKSIDEILIRAQTYCNVLELIHKDDPEFTGNMQEVQAHLLKLVNKLNDIAMHAMAINDQYIYYRCEDKKRLVRDTMETIRNLYM